MPGPLAACIDKGSKDCGRHEWYRSEGTVWLCYHCSVGRVEGPDTSPLRLGVTTYAELYVTGALIGHASLTPDLWRFSPGRPKRWSQWRPSTAQEQEKRVWVDLLVIWQDAYEQPFPYENAVVKDTAEFCEQLRGGSMVIRGVSYDTVVLAGEAARSVAREHFLSEGSPT